MDWLLKCQLPRHQLTCISGGEKRHGKKSLLLTSDILSGRLKTTASKLMLDEVFTMMKSDDISDIAKTDFLILALGETWLRLNISNKPKRKYYASQRMGLISKLLNELRKMEKNACKEDDTEPEVNNQERSEHDPERTDEKNTPSVDAEGSETPMWNFLTPSNFDNVTKAAIQVALLLMDNEEQLKAPSNAIKLKYDLTRLVNAKWAYIQKNNKDPNEARKCEIFLRLITLECTSQKVTRLARLVLAGRQLNRTKEIPSPEDISKLTAHNLASLLLTSIWTRTERWPTLYRSASLSTIKDVLGR